MSAERQSNFELLRIIAMAGIVLSHIAGNGHWPYELSPPPGGDVSFNIILLQSFLPFGRIGVYLFVLISGYFMIESKRSGIPKAVKLWVQVLFYSILIAVVAYLLFDDKISIVTVLTPITSVTWWFASSFLLLLLLSPMINTVIHNLNEVSFLELIICCLIFWSVIPAIVPAMDGIINTGWLFTTYLVGAYIKLYPHHFSAKASRYFLIALLCYVILLATAFWIDEGGLLSAIGIDANPIEHSNRQLTFAIAFFVFIGISKVGMDRHRFINALAATAFGIYLLHVHPLAVQHLYTDVFDIVPLAYEAVLPLYVLLMFVSIFSVCALIDYARLFILDKHLLKNLRPWVSSIRDRIDVWIVKWIGTEQN